MGRKKRKLAEAEAPAAAASDVKMESPPPAVIGAIPRKPPASVAPPAANAPPAATAAAATATPTSNTANNSTPSVQIKSATMANNAEATKLSEEDYLGAAKPSSQYGLHSHAGDLVEDDVYVSEGSLDSYEDEEDEHANGEGNENENAAANGGEKKKNEIEVVITTSRMGLMRRGGLSSLLGQPQANRTWVRGDNKDGQTEGDGTKTEDQTGENADGVKAEEDEENLDPAQRLALQQRKIEEAKREARIVESSENAGRDPCLFSKRTAFDIRLDQVEERPWDKPEADPTDYFNYGMDDADWLEYAEGQLAIRQELTDASKQKRLPDPGIVTVVPRAPKVQGDRVAVRTKKPSEEEKEDEVKKEEDDDDEEGVEMGVELGPLGNKAARDDNSKKEGDKATKESVPDATAAARNEKVVGGAWGAGASKDSVLLKLIQEQSGGGPGGHNMGGGRPHLGGPPHMMGGPRGPPQQFGGPGPGGPGQWPRDRFQNQFNRQGSGGPGGYHPPPPQQQQGFQRGPPPGGPPGQFHQRGGPGGGQGPPPQGRYPPQQQQGHWGGGGGAPGGGRGFPDQRGGPPPPHRGGPPPNGQGPPHGGGGGWDSRKRPRSEYGGGGDPRGDPRRGRW